MGRLQRVDGGGLSIQLGALRVGGFPLLQAGRTRHAHGGGGNILFTGATSSIRGRKGAPAFSSAKFAVRGLADALARELWPQGVHVAHIVVDGIIDTAAVRAEMSSTASEPLLNPDEMAETYWALTRQKPSAWTYELELRPKGEAFFV